MGRSKKSVVIEDDGFDEVEVEEGAELADFNRFSRAVKDYTHFLKDYSDYDAFAPITEDSKSEDFRVNNLYRRKRLTRENSRGYIARNI